MKPRTEEENLSLHHGREGLGCRSVAALLDQEAESHGQKGKWIITFSDAVLQARPERSHGVLGQCCQGTRVLTFISVWTLHIQTVNAHVVSFKGRARLRSYSSKMFSVST